MRRNDGETNAMLLKVMHDKCRECCTNQRSLIAECTSTDCPLWKYRPYQKKKAVDKPVDQSQLSFLVQN